METLEHNIKYIGERLSAAYYKLVESRWLYIMELVVLITWLFAMIFDF
jgi:hypothetical protein